MVNDLGLMKGASGTVAQELSEQATGLASAGSIWHQFSRICEEVFWQIALFRLLPTPYLHDLVAP